MLFHFRSIFLRHISFFLNSIFFSFLLFIHEIFTFLHFLHEYECVYLLPWCHISLFGFMLCYYDNIFMYIHKSIISFNSKRKCFVCVCGYCCYRTNICCNKVSYALLMSRIQFLFDENRRIFHSTTRTSETLNLIWLITIFVVNKNFSLLHHLGLAIILL